MNQGLQHDNNSLVPCGCGERCRRQNMVDITNPQFICSCCKKVLCSLACIPSWYRKYRRNFPQELRVYVCWVCAEKHFETLELSDEDDDDDEEAWWMDPRTLLPCACGASCRSKRIDRWLLPRYECVLCDLPICGMRCLPFQFRLQNCMPEEERVFVCMTCFNAFPERRVLIADSSADNEDDDILLPDLCDEVMITTAGSFYDGLGSSDDESFQL